MAGTFNIKIEGLKELTAAWKKAPEEVEPIMQKAIAESAVVLASNTDSNTVPFKVGDLIRSFKPVKIDRLIARWFPRVDYARAVQFGMPASPGRFVPAIGKRLKNGKNIGTWPGFRGRHYMEKIRAASVEDINRIFKQALKDATHAIVNNK